MGVVDHAKPLHPLAPIGGLMKIRGHFLGDAQVARSEATTDAPRRILPYRGHRYPGPCESMTLSMAAQVVPGHLLDGAARETIEEVGAKHLWR